MSFPALSPVTVFILTLAVGFGLAKAIVLSAPRHGHLTMDSMFGVQKFHSEPTPRVGGVAIYLALAFAWLLLPTAEDGDILGVVLVAGLPALFIGLLEDLTKHVSVRSRLFVTMGSGALAALITGVGLTRVDIPPADFLLSVWPVAVLFTAFCVGGVANAFNIIDGFHGLSSGTLILSALGLAVIAHSLGDPALAWAAIALAAAVGGFWLVNFPWGKLFLGDGGAYFAGFALAWLTVILLVRHPQVSPWCSVLLCGYPTVEAVYSIYRRRRQRRSPGEPDRYHLHSLVATQFVQPRLARLAPFLRNAAVSVLMWGCAVVAVTPAVLFPTHGPLLLGVLAGCFAGYHFVYRHVAASAAPAGVEVTSARS